MNFNELELKLSKYYEKFFNPRYVVGDWVIVDDSIYKQLKNKLNIVSILSNNLYENECVIVIETKKEYYVIKYSGRFICIRRSESEYGLVSDNYNLLAIKKTAVGKEDVEIIPFKDLCKILDWKLGKKAREYLNYFR